MDAFVFIWEYAIPFIFVLTVLVFVHELGHYALARRNGVKVEVFSIGFGPELFGWTDAHETRWKIAAIPMGGYVKMLGEGDLGQEEGLDEAGEKYSAEDLDRSFASKTLLQRSAIVFAGPAANFIFALFVFAGLFFFSDNPVPYAGIGEVMKDSAAEEAGFKTGDLILKIDGVSVTYFDDLKTIVSVSADKPLRFVVKRASDQLTLTAVPKASGEDNARGLLGVRPDPKQVELQQLGFVQSLWRGTEHTFLITGKILGGIGEMISGDRGSEEIGGPLRIAQLSGQVAQGGFINLLNFIAAFSINLCLINLFPIPMLDGGHLAFYAIEAMLGRPLGEKAQEYGFRFGLILVLALMLFATFNDLEHFKVFEFLKNLVT